MPAPGMGANLQAIEWIVDICSIGKGYLLTGVTNKNGASRGRFYLTALRIPPCQYVYSMPKRWIN
jgi:hypothetical protein